MSVDPRSERPQLVILKKTREWPGLSCRTLSRDKKDLLVDTMEEMMVETKNRFWVLKKNHL